MQTPIQSQLLSEIPDLVHGFTHRQMPDATLQKIIAQTQLPKQIHTDQLVWAEKEFSTRPEADAIATFQPGLSIGVQSADCVPLLFAAISQGKVFGVLAVHAGWRGTRLHIVEKTLQEFLSAAQKRRPVEKVAGAIGPCISAAVYEVGEDVAQHFQAPYIRSIGKKQGQEKYLLDIGGENQAQAERVSKNIRIPISLDRLAACTASQADLFPSYRRDGALPGRIISFLYFRS